MSDFAPFVIFIGSIVAGAVIRNINESSAKTLPAIVPTAVVPTPPVSTSPVTTSPVTTSPVTTSPVTTSPVTTSPAIVPTDIVPYSPAPTFPADPIERYIGILRIDDNEWKANLTINPYLHNFITIDYPGKSFYINKHDYSIEPRNIIRRNKEKKICKRLVVSATKKLTFDDCNTTLNFQFQNYDKPVDEIVELITKYSNTEYDGIIKGTNEIAKATFFYYEGDVFLRIATSQKQLEILKYAYTDVFDNNTPTLQLDEDTFSLSVSMPENKPIIFVFDDKKQALMTILKQRLEQFSKKDINAGQRRRRRRSFRRMQQVKRRKNKTLK